MIHLKAALDTELLSSNVVAVLLLSAICVEIVGTKMFELLDVADDVVSETPVMVLHTHVSESLNVILLDVVTSLAGKK